MSIKVIGAGFGRTGTLSLKFALEKLGYDKCYHMMEVMNHPDHPAKWAAAHRGERIDWNDFYKGYQATVDWPSCNLWQTHADYFPEAKIILTLRDPDSWYKSVMSTIYPSSARAKTSKDPKESARGEWASEIIWDHVFDGRMDDKDHVIDTFNRHNENIKEMVSADRLLIYGPPYGWETLCEFLKCDIPDSPYPKVNSTEDFLSRVR